MDSDGVAVMYSPLGGIARMHFQQISLLHLLHGFDIYKRRVQEVVALARQQLKCARSRIGPMPRFNRRSEADDRVQSLVFQRLAVKLRLTAGGVEVPLRKRQESLCGQIVSGRKRLACGRGRLARTTSAKIQTDMRFALQPFTVDSLQPGMIRLQSKVDHLVHRLLET